MTSNYGPGPASREKLDDLCDDMVRVIMLAYKYSEVDFSVVETRRDREQQQRNIDRGVSWTMDSDHLREDESCERNGVLAADIYPYVNGATNHDEKYYMLIAKAVFRAAGELGVQIKWGGFWKDKRKDVPHWAKRRNT